MRLIVYIVLSFATTSIMAQDAFTEANKNYIEEHYKTAAKNYEKLIDSTQMSAELYYNLGNAYFKSNSIGKAIWAYETALKINPKNEDAKFNLEFVNLKTEVQIDHPEPAITEWLKRLLFGPNINLWSYASILSSFIFSFFLLIFFITKSKRRRSVSIMGGMTFFIILCVSTTTAFFHKETLTTSTEGIVIAKKVDVRISPLKKANVTFKLFEGDKVKLLEENEDWLQIDVNGNSGWIKKESIWKI